MMATLQITVKDPEAEKQLRSLAEKGLIEINGEENDFSEPSRCRKAGWGKGTFIIHPSFYEPLEEFREYE